ncbi:MAG TPA: biotin/lipoyl-binding protein [Arenimonas sp.]|uniref:HlyD family secretion protein n=1 Tax=Arenimonas sp. TaxID=1872635 RepID=UPI002BB59DB1|nr:biotin/lipoyl-binding protein [Arenimonas sp.]HMB58063.1 biotin/lipoyl-binding protein [Arenimonas sp.]
MRLDHLLIASAVCVGLAGCGSKADPVLLGTLEWDRIALPAEASEPVLTLAVKEGDQVGAGQLLLTLDGRRMDAKLAQAQAQVAQQQAQLAELVHGARSEQLDAARAALASAQAGRIEADKQFRRQADLAAKQLVARATLDTARATRDRADAQVATAEAQLRELTHGTRVEQVEQAEAALAAAKSARDEIQLNRSKLDVRAPRAGRIDALPFKPGDQPPINASVASLLVGDAPYARVFVPASQRAGLRDGEKFLVRAKGIDHDLAAHLRSVASEPAFTPYYALTGDDASRLVYRAELVIDAIDGKTLPAGLPVEARPAQ